ncbi:hypothetical protein IC582_014006 [Cucumis melo]
MSINIISDETFYFYYFIVSLCNGVLNTLIVLESSSWSCILGWKETLLWGRRRNPTLSSCVRKRSWSSKPCSCRDCGDEKPKSSGEKRGEAESRSRFRRPSAAVPSLSSRCPSLPSANLAIMSYRRSNFIETDDMFLQFEDNLDNIVGGSSFVGDNTGSSS